MLFCIKVFSIYSVIAIEVAADNNSNPSDSAY